MPFVISYASKVHRASGSAQGTPALLCILVFSLVFTPCFPNAVASGKHHLYFQALVVLKPLVSLIGRLVACSARIAGDKRTDRHTHTNQVM